MAMLVILEEQHLDRQLLTVAIQATDSWEAIPALVKLQEGGLEVYLPVKVCCHWGKLVLEWKSLPYICNPVNIV